MKRLPILVTALFLAGCAHRFAPGPAVQSPDTLPARFQAAMQVSGQAQRDDALQKVARDAAAAKQAALAKEALRAIAAVDTQERAAVRCALALSANGDPKSAIEVAQLISTQHTRDEVLVKSAKGP